MTEKIQKFLDSQLDRVKGFEEIGLPEDGEQIMIVSDESFNALTFLIYMIQEYGTIEELILSFYSFNMKSMELIETLIEKGTVKKFVFQTSDLRKYGSDAKIPLRLSAIKKRFGADKIQGSFINSHAKIMLCFTGGKYYVVEGSGNTSKMIKTEQYLIEQSEQSYKFHKDWILNHDRKEDIK